MVVVLGVGGPFLRVFPAPSFRPIVFMHYGNGARLNALFFCILGQRDGMAPISVVVAVVVVVSGYRRLILCADRHRHGHRHRDRHRRRGRGGS